MLRNMACIYIFHEDKLLMLYRVGSSVVDSCWCGVGGHFEKDELNDPESCILRELFEETGLRKSDIAHLQLRYITLRRKNDEIRQNHYFFADLLNKEFVLPPCDEGILEWVSTDDVLRREMPYTAKYCLAHFFETGNTNKQYAGVATDTGIHFVELSEF